MKQVKIDAILVPLVRMLRRYWKTLVAVLGGNLLYFAVLLPYLPPAAHHRPARSTWDWPWTFGYAWPSTVCWRSLFSTSAEVSSPVTFSDKPIVLSGKLC